MTKNVTVQENISVSESITATTRGHDQINFWFLVKFSLARGNEDNKKRMAFLMNAVVMSMTTVECLLDNLAEQYLTDANYKAVSAQDGTIDRLKLTIKHLAGQYGEFSYDEDFGNRKLGVKHVEVESIFSGQSWENLVALVRLRNKIVHRKTQDRVWKVDGEERSHKGLDDYADVNLGEAINLISHLEIFFYELKELFSNSIVDYLAPRKESFFSFLEINKNVE
jgi:hypothetical protein